MGGQRSSGRPPARARKTGDATRATTNQARRGGAEPAPPPSHDLLDMDEAVALLKTSRPTFYRWLRSGRLKGMKVGRKWRFRRADVEAFLHGQEPRIDLPVDIGPLIDQLAVQLTDARGIEMDTHERDAATAANLALWLAHARRATDLHVAAERTSERSEPVLVIRLRIDGSLREAARGDRRLLPALIERFKTMAACDPHERRRPQDGRIALRLDGRLLPDGSREAAPNESKTEVRVCFLPTLHGEAMAARMLPEDGLLFELDRLRLAPDVLSQIREAIHAPNGLVVINGPTGSGKTTTLYACLLDLDREHLKVISVEDPIEVAVPWVEQTQVDKEAGLDFTAGLRAALRSDPDVVMCGEVRSGEHARLLGQLALTGHLVLTTTHARGATGALQRLIDLTGDPLLIGDATRVIVSQLLFRVLDPKRAETYEPDKETLARVRQLAAEGGLDPDTLPARFSRPTAEAGPIGAYRGRGSIHEILWMTPELARAIRRNVDDIQIRRLAIAQGMRTLAADGILRAARGETSLEEIFRVVGIPTT